MIPSPHATPIPSPRGSGERVRERGLRILATLLLSLSLSLTLSPFARAAQPVSTPTAEPALTGAWLAKAADGRVFAGTWSAAFAAATPDSAIGAWKLVDETGTKVLMRGTWSARRAKGAWRGTWSARVEGGGDASGKWTADAATAAGAKTFRDLLTLTREKQIGGTWTAGHSHGNWWLKPLQ
jgi:hypothetical protein